MNRRELLAGVSALCFGAAVGVGKAVVPKRDGVLMSVDSSTAIGSFTTVAIGTYSGGEFEWVSIKPIEFDSREWVKLI